MTLIELAAAPESAACCSTASSTAVGAEEAEDLARDLKAVADPARLRLLSLVAAHPDAEACVCDLTAPVGLSQPTVSHHLKVLVEAGYLTRSKRGTWAYYRLVPERIQRIGPALSALTAPPVPRC